MDLNEQEVKSLCIAIVEQALEDYENLLRRGVQSITVKGFTYSLQEIEEFFDSEYGESILTDGIGYRWMHGPSLLQAITA